MKKFLLSALFLGTAMMSNAVIIQNFENIAKVSDPTDKAGTFFVYNSNFAPLTLVDNPKKVGINTSNKVVAVQIFTTAANSGIIKINFPGTGSVDPILTYPTCPTCTDAKYDRLRIKYYKGNLLNKYVELEPNGSATSPKTLVQAVGEDEWEYITFELPWSTYTSFQMRVNRNDTGTGSATGTNADGSFIYIDDFEFYNSVDGPATGVENPKTNGQFTCTDLGDGLFCLQSTFDKKSNVRVDLISVDGRIKTVFNRQVEGDLDEPLQVPSKGMYFVRMTVDNNDSEVVKIISQK